MTSARLLMFTGVIVIFTIPEISLLMLNAILLQTVMIK